MMVLVLAGFSGCEPQLLLPGGGSFVGLNVCENVPYIPTVVSPQPLASSAVALPANEKFEITNAWPAEIADAPSADDKLRAEALSLNHVLTHQPANPFCHACKNAKIKKQQPQITGQTNRLFRIHRGLSYTKRAKCRQSSNDKLRDGGW